MTVQIPQLKYLAPPPLADEIARLDDLYSLDVLDTASEERFDQYTRLAATILDVPLAAISLVDSDRQWFKSTHGFSLREMPRDISFCGHAMANPEVMVIPDALSDERFLANPMVIGEPKIRFYVGAVIRGAGGQPIGTCCAMNHDPKQPTEKEIHALRQIARMIEREMLLSVSGTEQKTQSLSAPLVDRTLGLPNIDGFRTLVERELADATSSSLFMLALIRVLRFDALDAALGRQALAYLLGTMAVRLKERLGQHCRVGSIREDKIGLLLPVSSLDNPEAVVHGIAQVAQESTELGDHLVRLDVHIGASQYPADATDYAALLRKARTALWSIPLSTKSGHRLFRKQHSESASRRFVMESAIRAALSSDEFQLVYQPQFSIKDGRLVGAEALLRWHSATLGPVPPDEFIPIAEDSGLIQELGAFVLDLACRQIKEWLLDGCCPVVCVNITSHQLREPGFPEQLIALLVKHDIPADHLELELTESALVDDIKGAANVMHQLRKAGISIAIDDFGTGFSSLSYLQKLPIKTLKIDRSFVSRVPKDSGDVQIIKSIVSMAHALELSVVAEGVETDSQLDFLESVSCDIAQGFYFSRPLAPEKLQVLAKTGLGRSSG